LSLFISFVYHFELSLGNKIWCNLEKISKLLHNIFLEWVLHCFIHVFEPIKYFYFSEFYVQLIYPFGQIFFIVKQLCSKLFPIFFYGVEVSYESLINAGTELLKVLNFSLYLLKRLFQVVWGVIGTILHMLIYVKMRSLFLRNLMLFF